MNTINIPNINEVPFLLTSEFYDDIINYMTYPKEENKNKLLTNYLGLYQINSITNIINIIDADNYIPYNIYLSNKIVLCVKFPLLTYIYSNVILPFNMVLPTTITLHEIIEYDGHFPIDKMLNKEAEQYVKDVRILLHLNDVLNGKLNSACICVQIFYLLIQKYYLLNCPRYINVCINKINELIAERQYFDQYLMQYNQSFDLILSWRDQFINILEFFN